MQFIVKPNSSDHWLLFKRLVRIHSTRALIVLAGLVLFSSGFMFGLMFAIDGSTSNTAATGSSGCPQDNVQDEDDNAGEDHLPPIIAWDGGGGPHNQPNSDSENFVHHPRGLPSAHPSSSYSSSITKVSLLTLITSGLEYKNRRDAIRDTWVKLIGNNSIKYYFVLGGDASSSSVMSDLRKEQEEYKDMLILPHISDNYITLTRKLLESLRWSHSRMKYRFLLKVDDDSFVRIDRLYSELQTRFEKTKRLYWGFFDGRAPIKKDGKWSEEKWFLCDRYLPYALGGGYVLSSPLVKYIVNNAHLLHFYKSEDVTIGTWLSPLNITRIHEPRFDTEFKSRGCSNSFLITHKQSVEKMFELFNNVGRSGNLCKPEIMLRKAYFYNWNTNPSSCCFRNISFL